jgi:hypothetical protein
MACDGDGPLSPIAHRYPRGRHSWLPFWMARLDEHVHSIKAALTALKHTPSEYVLSGRYFQSIEIPEGARLTKTVIDLLGEDILCDQAPVRVLAWRDFQPVDDLHHLPWPIAGSADARPVREVSFARITQ